MPTLLLCHFLGRRSTSIMIRDEWSPRRVWWLLASGRLTPTGKGYADNCISWPRSSVTRLSLYWIRRRCWANSSIRKNVRKVNAIKNRHRDESRENWPRGLTLAELDYLQIRCQRSARRVVFGPVVLWSASWTQHMWCPMDLPTIQ